MAYGDGKAASRDPMKEIDSPLQAKNPKEAIALYCRWLKMANKEHDDWAKGAERRLKRYRGDLMPGQVNQQGHRISVPSGTATIDSLYSSLTSVEIDIELTATGAGTKEQEYLSESALQHEWRVNKVQRKTERAIKEALLTDIGWAKVFYEYGEHEEMRAREPEEMKSEMDDIYTAGVAEGVDPSTLDPGEVADQIATLENITVIDMDRIQVEYVPFDAIRFDPTAKRWEEVRWVCQVTQLPLYEVQNNPDYVEYCTNDGTLKKLKELKADSQISETVRGPMMQAEDEDDMVYVYEMWHLASGKTCTFTKEADFYLYEAPNPLGIYPDLHRRSPFVPCILREDPERVRGIGDMRLIMPILAEMDLYRSNLATYTDRYTPKHLHKEGVFSESGKKALHSREYGVGVEMNAGFEVTDVRDITPPPLPAEIFSIPDRLENEIREATGVSELMRGMFPDGTRRSATETQQVVAGSTSRQAEKRNRLAEFYTEIAHRILTLMQIFYDQERIMRLVDEYGEFQWVWNNEDIVMDWNLEIALTPKIEKTQQQKTDDAIALANLLGPLPIVDQASLVNYMLEEMGLPRTTIAELVKTPEDTQVDQQAELQSQAEQQAVAAGATPNPTNLPGPFAGADLAAAANPGEIPPGLAGGGAGGAPGSEAVVADILEQG
jgi:hypothetical protein